MDAYGIERRNYYYRLAYSRPASRKYARKRDGGKGGWITRAEEFIAKRFHLIAGTNGNANLEVIGIRHLFDHVVTAAMAGAAKPAAQVFELAVEVGGADKQQTLHVGDHPMNTTDGYNAVLFFECVNHRAKSLLFIFLRPQDEKVKQSHDDNQRGHHTHQAT